MFAISEEAKKRVYEIFNRTEEMVKEDAQTVKEWMKSQPHLPEILSDTQIKNFLNLNKFSLEKAKQKIDMYYTMRSLMADFYSVSNPKLERTQRLLDKMHVCTFPEALDGIHRVIFIKVKESDVLDMETFTALLFAVFEVRIHEDFMFSDILILDMENVSLNDVRKVTPSLLKQPIILYQKIYSFRLKKLYFVNSSPFISSLISLLKMILKPKLFERVEIHEDDQILYEVFTDDQRPKEFGGKGPSLQELSDNMRKKFSDYQERFDLLDTLRIDESLRPEKLDNDEILGFYGHFRKLDID